MKIDTREYAVEVRRLPDEEGGGWLAEVMDLPGCVSDGETVAEAFENAQGAIASWIEAAEEAGKPVPAPSTMVHYSGKWLMRVPKSLHRRLAEQARHEGVSLNAQASAILAEGVGYRTRGKTGRQRKLGTAGKRADTYDIGEVQEVLEMVPVVLPRHAALKPGPKLKPRREPAPVRKREKEKETR